MNLQDVLLIGGMGYVGRKLQEPLLKAGYKVHVIDRKARNKKETKILNFMNVCFQMNLY